ncbi:hypothetical protein BOTBODRAFT_271992 [Botryobasidium botryosum FD-172 SS1]|uniref:Uncharacterized protein n=1 Tax=Botryobasidium botryosum (strain FD-172 SS1) TaxID=930990 RepID=A0A067LSK7_BOTB1|nr:hypothetical protein BOTBODRAFT_271992 [Botryobasidium botryosum FD-172 SS1]
MPIQGRGHINLARGQDLVPQLHPLPPSSRPRLPASRDLITSTHNKPTIKTCSPPSSPPPSSTMFSPSRVPLKSRGPVPFPALPLAPLRLLASLPRVPASNARSTTRSPARSRLALLSPHSRGRPSMLPRLLLAPPLPFPPPLLVRAFPRPLARHARTTFPRRPRPWRLARLAPLSSPVLVSSTSSRARGRRSSTTLAFAGSSSFKESWECFRWGLMWINDLESRAHVTVSDLFATLSTAKNTPCFVCRL